MNQGTCMFQMLYQIRAEIFIIHEVNSIMGKDGYLYLRIVFSSFFHYFYPFHIFFLTDEKFKVCLYYFRTFKWSLPSHDAYIVNNTSKK